MTGNEDILLSAHDASQQSTITVKRWESRIIESSLEGGGYKTKGPKHDSQNCYLCLGEENLVLIINRNCKFWISKLSMLCMFNVSCFNVFL